MLNVCVLNLGIVESKQHLLLLGKPLKQKCKCGYRSTIQGYDTPYNLSHEIDLLLVRINLRVT